MITVNVEYFAILREHVGFANEVVDTSADTVGALFEELDSRHAFPRVGQLKVAVNAEFGDWQTPLSEGDAVVFIPPVAGG